MAKKFSEWHWHFVLYSKKQSNVTQKEDKNKTASNKILNKGAF